MELNVSKKSNTPYGDAVVELVLALLLEAFKSYVVMVLWNWVAVQVLLLPNISFWQAIGLLGLAQILFTRSEILAKIKE